jgi:DUF971 family protein
MTPSLLELRSDATRRVVVLVWADDLRAELPHALLRSRCACAQCRQARRGAERSIADDVTIDAIEPYGANAVRLTFSDAHSRGIFPFEYLRRLASQEGHPPF